MVEEGSAEGKYQNQQENVTPTELDTTTLGPGYYVTMKGATLILGQLPHRNLRKLYTNDF